MRTFIEKAENHQRATNYFPHSQFRFKQHLPIRVFSLRTQRNCRLKQQINTFTGRRQSYPKLQNYFRKLKEITKERLILYLSLLILSTLFILWIAIAAFVSPSDVIVDWAAFGLIALFILSIVFQNLLLLKKCYPLFIFRVLVVILLGFQLLWLPSIGSKTIDNGEKFDNILGRRLQPNLHDAQRLRIVEKDTLFIMYYSTDSLSRRIPDDDFMEEYSKNQQHHDKHAVFFGCSFTFGDGLMYSSTFPYLFEKTNHDYKSYNYGVSGWGPHQIALLFDKRINTINEDAIPEEKGFALYTYMLFHMDRMYYSYYYDNDESKKDKRWFKMQKLLYKVVTNINLVKALNLKFNQPREEWCYKQFADTINYTARQYWELKPDNHFYVSIYPGWGGDLNWLPYLDEKIVVLKMKSPADFRDNQNKYLISPQYDWHPTEEFNAYYVKELTKLIKEYED